MKRVMYIAVFTLAAIISQGLSYGQSDTKVTRDVKNFSSVLFGISGNLFISFGSEYNVVLEGDQELIEDIETEVSGGKLVIRKETWRQGMNKKITIYITMPEIEGLGVSGSGQAEIKDAVKADDLDLSVSGSGRLYINDITAENMDCSISGSGDIIVKGNGSVSDAEIGISGSGNYTGESLKIESAEIGISGSGSCLCNVTESLEAHVSGSGSVTYEGNPRVDARVSGSGRVRSR